MAGDKEATVLIAGGGVAGLTAAIALRHYGIDSVVFEQADDLSKIQAGGGLYIHLNATRAFEHLGILDELTMVSAPLRQFDFVTDKGKHLGRTPAIEGEVAVGVVRRALHELLAGAAGRDSVQAGAKLDRFEQDEAGVTAHFADGRKARGDVLIGADGLGSTVRRQLLGESEPRHTGNCTRRAVVESELATDGVHRSILGRGQRFKVHPVNATSVYWIAATNEPPGGGEDGPEIKRTVLERFRDWPEPLEELVEATDESKIIYADTVDRDPVDRWGEGRVTLLGDAAHPMTWDRGQGACQSIEGAVFLAKELAEVGRDPASALRAWEAHRIPRTRKMVLTARRSNRLEQSESALACMLRNQLFRVATKGENVRRGHRNLMVDYEDAKEPARPATAEGR